MHLFKEAIIHKGFALVDVLQVCVTYNNLYEYYAKRVYELQNHDTNDPMTALTSIREWDYNSNASIALGVFYRKDAETFEEKFTPSRVDARDRDSKIRNFSNKST